MAKKNKTEYFKVVAIEGTDTVDVLLYGYIGQVDWWSEDDSNDITDIAFIKKLRELEKDYDNINIRINSPGGSMYHGNAIVSAIRNSSSNIHTYNDGLAASMAADIWLAAPNRSMATNSLLMIHAASTGAWGTAKDLRHEAEVADKFTGTAVIVCAESTGLTEKEVKELFYDDYEDHRLTYQETKELNFITDTEEYEADEVIDGIEKMTFTNIMKHFASTEDTEATGLLRQIQNKFNAAMKVFIPVKLSQQNSHDMSVEELTQAIETGDLTVEDLQKAINENKPTPPANPDAKLTDAPIEKTVEEIVAEAMKPLIAKIETQATEIENLNAQPGAGITKPVAVAGDDFSDGNSGDEFADLDALNAQAKAAVTENENLRFN